MNEQALYFTRDVVSSYVANNPLPATEVPSFIASVYAAVSQIGTEPVQQPAAEAPVPAVPIKKSVQHDFIVCLEDGKKFKSLKRHLTGPVLKPSAVMMRPLPRPRGSVARPLRNHSARWPRR